MATSRRSRPAASSARSSAGSRGGGKGAAIGAGAGAGAGTILMLATKGDEVELEAGQRLNVQMTSSTSVQVLAQR